MSYDNDSPNWVYFDDFKVTHTTTNVIQYNEYYPFGLRTENSWTREDHSNKFLYNAGAELNANSGWYETFFRGYDAALGRFMQVDPLASVSSSHSPYHYAYNNPVLFNDPLGDRPEEVMRDLERYGGGGHSYQMYDYSDSWGQGSGNNQYGQHRIGPGSGNHWSNQYSNAYRDHFLMNGNDFAAKYGRSSQAYQEMLNASNADWGKPTGTSDYVEGSFDTNKYGSWLLMNGSWVDMTSSDQMANRSAWTQQGAADSYEFKVIHSANDSFGLDWFVETKSHGNLRYTQTAVMIFYNTSPGESYGKVIEMIRKSRYLYSDAGGFQSREIPYRPTLNMQEWIDAAIEYHDFTSPPVLEKYMNFILTPKPPPGNRLNAVTGKHR